MLERDQLARRAREERLTEALRKLDEEHQACSYLIQTGRFKAAELAAKNIVRMQETVKKFHDDLT